MEEFVYTITDKNGVHARPAGLLAQELQKFSSNIAITCGEKTADAKKLFSLLKLRIQANETISVSIEGDDESEAAKAARAFLAENL